MLMMEPIKFIQLTSTKGVKIYVKADAIIQMFEDGKWTYVYTINDGVAMVVKESAKEILEKIGVNKTNMNRDIDKEDTLKAVELLDKFTKVYCRYSNDYERFGDSKFRCRECPFKNGSQCRCKEFKLKYDPNYKNFGSIGDL